MRTSEGAIMEQRRGRVIASPRARRAMRERGIDPGAIHGTGPGGRIVEADVLRASAGSGDPRRALNDTRQALTAISASPHFWLRATADVTSLLSIQRQIDEEVRRVCGTAPRLADLLLRAVALALAESPEANRVWQDETLVARTTADVGLEVEVPDGRAFAVIRQADRLRLFDLVSRRAELARAARAGRLPPDMAQGAAIALLDLSDYAIDQYAAILLPPHTSAVAVGRPIALGSGDPRRARTLSVSLTADRRALAPETAAKLLGRIVEFLQRPFLLLCERQPR